MKKFVKIHIETAKKVEDSAFLIELAFESAFLLSPHTAFFFETVTKQQAWQKRNPSFHSIRQLLKEKTSKSPPHFIKLEIVAKLPAKKSASLRIKTVKGDLLWEQSLVECFHPV
jgi:hypothetical protein